MDSSAGAADTPKGVSFANDAESKASDSNQQETSGEKQGVGLFSEPDFGASSGRNGEEVLGPGDPIPQDVSPQDR